MPKDFSPLPIDVPYQGQPLVELTDVSVTRHGRPILSDISWSLHAGQHWAIEGRNGAGKSTLLRLVAGDVWPDPSRGRRRYHFKMTDPDSPIGVDQTIALVAPELQERYFRIALAADVRAVIATGLTNSMYLHQEPAGNESGWIDDLIGRFGLADLADCDIRSLSQGMMRRVLIARALARRPALLLLDECTNGLDRRTRSEIVDLIDRLANEGTTIVVASHRPGEFSATDRSLTLDVGRVISAAPATVAPAHRPRHAASRSDGFVIRFERANVILNGRTVLDRIDWQIEPGEHWLITGPNGAGKTVLGKALAGSLPVAADGGTIARFGGTPRLARSELQRRIAHIGDELQSQYDGRYGETSTVLDVVGSGFFASIGLLSELTGDQLRTASAVLEALDLAPYAGRRFLRLSFGERRKALIARALVTDPKIIILDEAFESLDAPFRRHFEAALHERSHRDVTIIAIAHQEDDVLPWLTHELRLASGRITRRASRRSGESLH